jgi:hypothetical protein
MEPLRLTPPIADEQATRLGADEPARNRFTVISQRDADAELDASAGENAFS